MENSKQVTLNGKPLWKVKHSELTAYLKKHGVEIKTGLKTYQIANLVKKHLEANTGSKEETPAQVDKAQQTKEKAVKTAEKGAVKDVSKEIAEKAKKLGAKTDKSGFEPRDKVSFIEWGTKEKRTGRIVKIIFSREKYHAQVKVGEHTQWVGTFKLTKV